MKARQNIGPPPGWLLALEPRGAFELARLMFAAPVLAGAPRGDGRPVIVFPGLGVTDRSTWVLRAFLKRLGHDVSGWERGRNVRPARADLPDVSARVQRIYAATGTPVALVGWSRGGLIARETARLVPEATRLVITLGTPFAAPGAANIVRTWRRLTGLPFVPPSAEEQARLAAPLPVPSTSIYSRSDGVVAWRACRETEGPQAENIEVRGAHIGLGHNPGALWAIADRLAQPTGEWARFRPPPATAFWFPTPK